MAEVDIYLDCDRSLAVTGQSNSSRKDLFRFTQGDTPLLRVHLFKGFSNVMTDYEVIPTTDLTLEATLGPRTGTSVDTYASQAVWTASEDLAYFEAEFALNTSEIDDLLGASEQEFAYFEIKYVRGGKPTTVLSERVAVWAAVKKPTSVVVPAGSTPLSAEAAGVTFHPKSGSTFYDVIDPATGGVLRLTNSGGVPVWTEIS